MNDFNHVTIYKPMHIKRKKGWFRYLIKVNIYKGLSLTYTWVE